MANLEIQPGRFYLGIWYADFPAAHAAFGSIGPFGRGVNVMAAVECAGEARPAGPVRWSIMLRFRYYRDERVHDSDDKFIVWRGEQVATLEDVEESMTTVFRGALAPFQGAEIADFFPVFGNFEVFAAKVLNAPPKWMHLDPERGRAAAAEKT